MLLRSRIPVLSSILILALFIAPVYSGTVTTFTNANSWQAALAGFQTLDFEGLAPAGGTTNYGSGLMDNNVQFLGLNQGAFVLIVLDTTMSPFFNYGTGEALALKTDRSNSGLPVPYIHVVLPSPVTAAGFNLFSASPAALTFTVNVGGNPYNVPTFSTPTPAYFGITSDTPFSTLDVIAQGTVFNGGTTTFVDNFSVGSELSSSSVPEPASCLFIGAGLAAIGLIRRKRSSRHS